MGEASTVEQRVIALLRDQLAGPGEDTQVTKDTNIEASFAPDSLDLWEMVNRLEEEFDIVIPDSHAEKLIAGVGEMTVGTILVYLRDEHGIT